MQHFFKLLKEMIQLKSRSAVVKERGKDLLRRDVGSYIDGLDTSSDAGDKHTLTTTGSEESEKLVVAGHRSAASVHPVPSLPGEPSFSPEPAAISPASSLPSVDSQSDDRSPKEDWKPKYKHSSRLVSPSSEEDTSQCPQHYMPLSRKTRAHAEAYMDVKPTLLQSTNSEQPHADYLDMSGNVMSPKSDGSFIYDGPPSSSYANPRNFPYSHSSGSSSS